MQDPLTPEWRAKVNAAAAVVIQEMCEGPDNSDFPTRAPPPNHSTKELTEKQAEVLRLLKLGYKQVNIAMAFGTDPGTVHAIVRVLRVHGYLPLLKKRRK